MRAYTNQKTPTTEYGTITNMITKTTIITHLPYIRIKITNSHALYIKIHNFLFTILLINIYCMHCDINNYFSNNQF